MNNAISRESRLDKLAYRIGDVAYVLSISESKVKRLLRSRQLGHIKDGGTTMITRRQVEAYLREKELEQGWKES
ncbi:helix-turn-helix domain protein [Candidatus Nitrosymbiomonas proteolyticus]|uniref:Helix-turn-helix domain protein n=1 Tax=Candidatus Nitrosymbiomonas proteolyticus TaxID=2608984 RepID=A0A809R6H6_9BACT|nr:helix-turn-helix domain protein [Candidatus Nitrosymbiomonas proteolyticus]